MAIVITPASNGSTSVSNIFIDRFLKDANDVQLKVYLYLVRNLSAKRGFDISELAEEFGHTERDIVRALVHWADRGLITLERNDEGEITCVGLNNLTAELLNDGKKNENKIFKLIPDKIKDANEREESFDADESAEESLEEETPGDEEEIEENLSDSEEELEEEPVSEPQRAEKPLTIDEIRRVANREMPPMKRDYSLDEKEEMKKDPAFMELLNLAGEYFRYLLGANDVQSMMYIYKELKFTPHMIDLLLQYIAGRTNRPRVWQAENQAAIWYADGVRNEGQIIAVIEKNNTLPHKVMKAIGSTYLPTEDQIQTIERWRKDGFSEEMILEACKRAVDRDSDKRFSYVCRIINAWKHEGIFDFNALAEADAKFQLEKEKKAQENQNASTKRKTKHTKPRNLDNYTTRSDEEWKPILENYDEDI